MMILPSRKEPNLTLIVNNLGRILLPMHFNYFNIFNVLVSILKKANKSRRWNMPFFTHLDFLQSPCQSFILPSYAKASIFALVDLCSILPSLEPKTHYHAGVEIFIDDEVKEVNV